MRITLNRTRPKSRMRKLKVNMTSIQFRTDRKFNEEDYKCIAFSQRGVLCNLQRDTNQLDSNKYPVNY